MKTFTKAQQELDCRICSTESLKELWPYVADAIEVSLTMEERQEQAVNMGLWVQNFTMVCLRSWTMVWANHLLDIISEELSPNDLASRIPVRTLNGSIK